MMKLKGNWGFSELYCLPIRLRNWFIKKTADYYQEVNKTKE